MPSDTKSTSEMSSATKEILGKVRQLIPPMLDKFHKGQLGRVGVIGGSEDYTGAPYFSAMASARLGCDMSHVICTPTAGAVIKTYSPNLMVHPYMRSTPSTLAGSLTAASTDTDPAKIAEPIEAMLGGRLHVLVVGPGLGRDSLMHAVAARVVRAARDRGVPVVLDADALLLVQKDPALVRGYPLAVLTPNVVEFGRLAKALLGGDADKDTGVAALAKALEGATVVQKGGHDLVSDGKTTLEVDLAGGKKRSGGQGDTLTGCIATFLAWRKAYLDGLWESGGKIGEEESLRLAVFGASAVTRECSRLAFEKKGRSLQASDLTDEVHTAFMNLFGEIDGDAGASKH